MAPLTNSRLCSLLTVAGSPSIQKTYGRILSLDSLFGGVIRSIGTCMAVDSFQLHDEIPSFKLDGNRYGVLKLLYTLISNNEFGGDASVRSQDLRITLMVFLRVLNSTSPRPRFLPEDWCTPIMAANFVRIAFQDEAWTSRDEPLHSRDDATFDHFSAAAELVHYFLRFPPVMNETFSRFVSGRLLDPIANLRGGDLYFHRALSMVLDAFIAGLESDVLKPETFQQSIAYLFEPKNLFTVCAVLLMQNKAPSALRRLALLRPDNPAWRECLKKLDTFPAHFEVEYSSTRLSHAIWDFQTFVEGGCVGVYRINMPGCQTPRRDHDGSYRPENTPPRTKLWLRLWNQFWLHRGRSTSAEVAMFSGNGQV
ncbi:uncharacterized protein EV420DRAFT_542936 [Desarmillaria tabescens]|uniref:Uncharacterized protein n=1 Tax=Armillaria tabescens TaxID=1929756 RepID=A0AA39N4P2_ARMTA|nr:uncharacterized protein EV420DRAFT_542936 [Desarmillaria tabescens]KAK0457160.1 hypothetical protein EV420DRAFT_542936 [Desarmillaria tabescens]